MLKEEFESRIGKRVEFETYALYNEMYNATRLDKDAFCKLLNLDAIPEDPAAVKAREEAAEIIKAQKQKINELRDGIKSDEENANYYLQYYNDRPQAAYYKEAAKVKREKLREEREFLRLLEA